MLLNEPVTLTKAHVGLGLLLCLQNYLGLSLMRNYLISSKNIFFNNGLYYP